MTYYQSWNKMTPAERAVYAPRLFRFITTRSLSGASKQLQNKAAYLRRRLRAKGAIPVDTQLFSFGDWLAIAHPMETPCLLIPGYIPGSDGPDNQKLWNDSLLALWTQMHSSLQ